ncbi:MAG TPA: LysM peptidoglycan-binding domain-containing protein [Streptosporangiaceae bacterium]
MSVMSVGQRPEATEHKDEMRDLGGRELAGRRTGGRDRPDREPCPRSRLERELRSRGPLARELRAHQTLTRELRARRSARRELGEGGLEGRARTHGLAPGRRGHGVRLTRRGRRAVTGFAAAIILAVVTAFWVAAATGAQAANHGVAPGTVYKNMRPVVVQPGQTLWSIALRADPAADPRVVISRIMEFNAMSSDVVVPGERLWVPGS